MASFRTWGTKISAPCLSIFAPFWVVNQTGTLLEYKGSFMTPKKTNPTVRDTAQQAYFRTTQELHEAKKILAENNDAAQHSSSLTSPPLLLVASSKLRLSIRPYQYAHAGSVVSSAAVRSVLRSASLAALDSEEDLCFSEPIVLSMSCHGAPKVISVNDNFFFTCDVVAGPAWTLSQHVILRPKFVLVNHLPVLVRVAPLRIPKQSSILGVAETAKR
jgi:hypothetical protein